MGNVNKLKLAAKCVRECRMLAPKKTGNLRENGIYATLNNSKLGFTVKWDNNKVPYMNIANVTSSKPGFIERGQMKVLQVTEEALRDPESVNKKMTSLKNTEERMEYINPLFMNKTRKILCSNKYDVTNRDTLFKKFDSALMYAARHPEKYYDVNDELEDNIMEYETTREYEGGNIMADIVNGTLAKSPSSITIRQQVSETDSQKPKSDEEKSLKKQTNEDTQELYNIKKQRVNRNNIHYTMALTVKGANLVNDLVGEYTGNKKQQQNFSAGLYLASQAVAIGFMTTPVIGMASAALTLGYYGISNEIKSINETQSSRYNRSLRGNMTTSGSRWRGGNV